MRRDVIPCIECMHYRSRVEKFKNTSTIHECTYWHHTVEGNDYCSRAEKSYPCRLCKYCRPLAGNEDKYLCVRERMAYYTDLEYSCSYYEKRKEINNEEVDC